MKKLMLVAVIAVTGCASAPTPRASAVLDADANMVTACTYVGEVSDTSSFGGAVTGDVGRNNARNKARDEAAGKGATHIVWNPQSDNRGMVVMSGKAYRCN